MMKMSDLNEHLEKLILLTIFSSTEASDVMSAAVERKIGPIDLIKSAVLEDLHR